MAKKEFAVFGLGRFGKSVALTLADAGCEVLIADHEVEAVQELADLVTYAVEGDVTNQELVKTLGISNYEGVIIATGGDLEASVMATILVKEIGVPYVLAKAKTELHGKILKKVGADKVVFPEKDTGIRIANQLMHGNYFDAIELSETYSIMDLDMPEAWVGQTMKTLDLRAKYKVNVIGMKSNGMLNINPGPDVVLQKDDVLIVKIGRAHV